MATLTMAAQSTNIYSGEPSNLQWSFPQQPVGPELLKPLHGSLVWTGDELASKDFELHLSPSDLEELDAALSHVKDMDEDRVCPATFPLDKLRAKLEEAALQVHGGCGFVVVKGIQGRYGVEDSVKVFLGISSYIADQRGRQDKKGNMLRHITSSKQWTVPTEQRHGIHSTSALPYHNDMGCDVLALQARQVATKGGLTYLSSSWTTFNKLLDREPEVAKTLLTANWPVQYTGRTARHYLAPAFAIHDGKLMASMDPHRFGPHPTYMGRNPPPSLSEAQKYALERVSAVAYESELGLRLEEGDVLFFNNWALLHRRDSYQDGEDSSRHLVRLWLRSSQLGWSVPAPMLPPWAAAYVSEDGSEKPRVYPLHPSKDYIKPKYIGGSAAYILEDADESEEEAAVEN